MEGVCNTIGSSGWIVTPTAVVGGGYANVDFGHIGNDTVGVVVSSSVTVVNDDDEGESSVVTIEAASPSSASVVIAAVVVQLLISAVLSP